GPGLRTMVGPARDPARTVVALVSVRSPAYGGCPARTRHRHQGVSGPHPPVFRREALVARDGMGGRGGSPRHGRSRVPPRTCDDHAVSPLRAADNDRLVSVLRKLFGSGSWCTLLHERW